MLTTVKDVYDNGKITLTEDPPVNEIKADVIVTFLPEQKNSKQIIARQPATSFAQALAQTQTVKKDFDRQSTIKKEQ